MAIKNIGFIGLGLIGGSIAKVLRREHPEYRLIAYNRTKSSLVDAMADQTINQATDGIDASFASCDIVFLCLPVSLNIKLLPKLAEILPERCIITDVGSVKSSIHEAASSLGLNHRFIGGHPMAGSEKTGYSAATDRLLENAYYIITPTPESDPEMVEDYRNLVKDMGALPIVIDPSEHDRATAAISHLPHIIAFTLVNLVRTSDNPDGLMRTIAAGGFRDITRIASSSPDMWESICHENRGQLLAMIETFKASLSDVEKAISLDQGDELHHFFEEAKNFRDDMPTKHSSGPLPQIFDMYVDIIDESGAIATLATILAANGISMKNIGIIHNREFQDGVLRIEFYDGPSVDKAQSLLTKFSYVVHRRD